MRPRGLPCLFERSDDDEDTLPGVEVLDSSSRIRSFFAEIVDELESIRALDDDAPSFPARRSA